MNFYKRRDEDPRDDEYEHWGTSVWYYQVNDDRRIERQLVTYECGVVLAYDMAHVEDEYGMLGEPLLDAQEWKMYETPASEFESQWVSARPRNR